MKPSEVLDQFGWIKGEIYRHGQGYCLWGAIVKSCNGGVTSDVTGLTNKTSDVISELFPTRVRGGFDSPIPNFNDHPDTTLEDVKLVLKHVESE